jgi:hypothetical protein
VNKPREAKKINLEIDEDLYNYFEFLEITRNIKNKQTGLNKALLFFKKLSMHDWLPDKYRIGENRIIIIDSGMLLDLFESMSEFEIYRLGCMTAMKRKIRKPEFREINLTKKENWHLVLNELQNFGWGNFEIVEDEIKIDNSAIPVQYIRGYLETLFKKCLTTHKVKIEKLIIFKVSQPETYVHFCDNDLFLEAYL